jgi:hypothetical protein
MSVELRTGSLALSEYSKKYPWIGACEVNDCYYAIAGKTKEEVEHKIMPENHRCPLKGSTHVGEMQRPKNGYERIWDELDECVSVLKDPDTSPEKKEIERRYAQGLAFALAAIGQYDLHSVEQINKEANDRWKMRTGQIMWRPTQGYSWGTLDDTPAWEHPNNEYWREQQAKLRERAKVEAAESRARAEAATPARSRGKVKKTFTEAQLASIRMAKAMISTADLAKMYGCTEADIEGVV